MGTNEIDPQVFGGLVANVKILLDNQIAIKDELSNHQNDIRAQLHDSNKRMFDKLDSVLDTVGSMQVTLASMKPICQQHTEEIAKLKERPGRLVEIGSAVIAAMCAAAMWLTRGH